MAQLSDEQMMTALDPEINSVALIVKHMHGNMQSRWSDFLRSDGEKPGRDRDAEFQDPPATKQAVELLWEQGWATLFQALVGLTDAELTRTATIRSEAHSVMQIINRQIGHYCYHCGQIVFLAKHLAGPDWQTLSIPRGNSTQFNQRVKSGEASQR